LLPRYLINGLSISMKLNSEYSLARTTDDLISGVGIHVDMNQNPSSSHKLPAWCNEQNSVVIYIIVHASSVKVVTRLNTSQQYTCESYVSA